MAKISSYVQTGISTWPKIYLYDTSDEKVRVGFIHCLLHHPYLQSQKPLPDITSTLEYLLTISPHFSCKFALPYKKTFIFHFQKLDIGLELVRKGYAVELPEDMEEKIGRAHV